MAKYADQTTEAEVGDIIKCVKPKQEMCKDLSADCSYKVVAIFDNYVKVESDEYHNLYSDRFELIKRTGAAPSPEPEQPQVTPMPAQPLVVWPEEKKKLTWSDLKHNELFVWLKRPNTPCLKDGSRWIPIANAAEHGHILLDADDEVRRIQFNPANKESVFTVI